MAQTFSKYSARPVMRVDLKALRHNYNLMKKQVGSAKVAASVKADAYGLGIRAIGRALYGAGCRVFFVATAGEGKILREIIGDNATIYALNGPASRDIGLYFKADIKPVINSMEQARLWASAIEPVGSPPFCAVHIDTGMNRLGFDHKDLSALASQSKLFEDLKVDLIMSHLACAPDKAHPMNEKQLNLFRQTASKFPIRPLSLANSAGIYLGKAYHFQMVRPGIALYGGAATTQPEQEATQPVVTLEAPILQIRDIKAGDTLGYDASFTAPKDMQVATLGIGYADGMPVSVSGVNAEGHKKNRGGRGVLHGQAVPIIGRVSMDLTIVNISAVKKPVSLGDMVSFRGQNLAGDARDAGTIDYELLVRLGQRSRREYE